MATEYISVDGGTTWQAVRNFGKPTTGFDPHRDKITVRQMSERLSVKIEESGTDDWGVRTVTGLGRKVKELFDIKE